MRQERQPVREKTDWWQRGLAAILFVLGIDIVAAAKTTADILLGAGVILGSAWLWGESKKQVSVTA